MKVETKEKVENAAIYLIAIGIVSILLFSLYVW